MRSICVVLLSVVFALVVLSASARAPHCKNCFKVLNTDIKNAAKKSMTAVVQAGLDLTRMRDEFSDQQSNLEMNLKKAKTMAKVIQANIGQAVKDIAAILEEATKKAKDKMANVIAASDALGDLQEKVQSKKVQDKAKDLRAMIAKGKPLKTKTQKNIMKENGIIAKLNAAKIIAKANAERKEKKIEDTKAVVRDDIARLEGKMYSAESQLKAEEQLELEDEREARSKIQEAVEHNKAALNKATKFLSSVEEGIQKFSDDIKQVPLTR